MRSGTTTTAASSRNGRTSGTVPVTRTCGRPSASARTRAVGLRPTIVSVDAGNAALDRRQHLVHEPGHAVLVRHPVHRAGEDDAARPLRDGARGAKEFGVDARWYRRDSLHAVLLAEHRGVLRGNGDDVVEAEALLALEAPHASPLLAHVEAAGWGCAATRVRRSQIIASTLCWKSTTGQGSPSGTLSAGIRKSHTTTSARSAPVGAPRADGIGHRRRAIWRDGERQRGEDVPQDREGSAPTLERRVAPRHQHELVAVLEPPSSAAPPCSCCRRARCT